MSARPKWLHRGTVENYRGGSTKAFPGPERRIACTSAVAQGLRPLVNEKPRTLYNRPALLYFKAVQAREQLADALAKDVCRRDQTQHQEIVRCEFVEVPRVY